MLSKLFRGRTRVASVEYPEFNLNSHPKAGEIRQQDMSETLFVSPLPMPTGQPALGRNSFSERNDIYLELGGSNKGIVEQGKQLAVPVWITISLAIFFPVGLTLLLMAFTPEHITRDYWQVLKTIFQVGSVFAVVSSAFLVLVVYWLTSDIKGLARQFPMRFNRQRREVCYVDHKRDNKVVIVPWEQVVAWVSSTQMVTQYGATRMHTFGLGLEQGKGEDILFLQWAMPSDAHSLGMWEAIRRYMEEGTPDNNQETAWLRLLGIELTELEKLPYEGLHTFEVERRIAYMNGNLHRDDEYSRRIGLTISKWPLRWWYVRRVLTFWKLPYWIAEWSHRVGRPVLPEQMQQWSQPLPSEQWAKPSEALRRASQEVQAAMAKGTGFAEACTALRDK